MIEKEFRALLPVWVACGLALVLPQTAGPSWRPLALPAFLLGAAVIGSWPFGHEYSFRTLDALLAQPVSRTRIWLAKTMVAAVMLAPFTIIAFLVTSPMTHGAPMSRAFYVLPYLGALFLAPWLTLSTGSALAGAVTPLAIAGILMVTGQQIYGIGRAQSESLAWFMTVCFGGLSTIAAPFGWWSFTRLESTGDRQLQLDFPSRPVQRAATLPGNQTWALVKKELRLQQLPFALAPGYAMLFGSIVLTHSGPGISDAAEVLMVIYVALLSMLIGALASAEERHLGTHDAQLLLPVGAARQWTIKVISTIGIAVLLAIVVPAALTVFAPGSGVTAFGRHGLVQPMMLALVCGLTSLSLYVSTLVSNGLRALMLAVPVLLAILTFATRFAEELTYRSYRFFWLRDDLTMVPHRRALPAGALVWGGILIVAAIMLARAFRHYRYADRSPLRIAVDGACLAGGLVVYWMACGALLY
jgi:hypothetical protein